MAVTPVRLIHFFQTPTTKGVGEFWVEVYSPPIMLRPFAWSVILQWLLLQTLQNASFLEFVKDSAIIYRF